MAGTMVELIQEGKDITTHLTDAEKGRLADCEQIIEKGFPTVLEVGAARAEIRDARLYRETHKTFEQYCRDRWDCSKTLANYQIAGSEAVQNLTTIVVKNNPDTKNPQGILPVNEAQTRPLIKLKPDDQVAAWSLVLEQLNDGKKLTSALVKKQVKQVSGEVAKKRALKVTEAVEQTTLVSGIFKRQAQTMLNIIQDERISGWKTTSRKEAVKIFLSIIEIIKTDR